MEKSDRKNEKYSNLLLDLQFNWKEIRERIPFDETRRIH